MTQNTGIYASKSVRMALRRLWEHAQMESIGAGGNSRVYGVLIRAYHDTANKWAQYNLDLQEQEGEAIRDRWYRVDRETGEYLWTAKDGMYDDC